MGGLTQFFQVVPKIDLVGENHSAAAAEVAVRVARVLPPVHCPVVPQDLRQKQRESAGFPGNRTQKGMSVESSNEARCSRCGRALWCTARHSACVTRPGWGWSSEEESGAMAGLWCVITPTSGAAGRTRGNTGSDHRDAPLTSVSRQVSHQRRVHGQVGRGRHSTAHTRAL